VSRLSKPQEPERDRTWFLPEKAKRRLQEGREIEQGAELAAVVERAVARVRRLRGDGANEVRGKGQKDSLQRVNLEAPVWMRFQEKAAAAAVAGYLRRHVRISTPIEARTGERREKERPQKIQAEIRQDLGQQFTRPMLRLGNGSKPPANTSAKVTAIDTGVVERRVHRAIRRPKCEL